MIELMQLLWYFLAAQPPTLLAELLSWHLLALLASLGLLSAFGIHFLMGHVGGFYRRGERIARWVSLPSLLMWLISVQLLLGAYLLGVHGSRLVSINQTDPVVNTLGAHLLEPAFANPALAEASRGAISKRDLKAAFKASTENRYREALAKYILTPEKLTASPRAGGGKGNRQPSPLGQRILVQVGMRWITAPHETWWTPLNPGGAEKEKTGKPGAKTDPESVFFLPVFLGGLLGDLADDEQLSRANWEHVAGTRFVEGYLQPVMKEYLAYFAIALALAVLLIDMLFFLALGRIKRIGLSRPEKAAQPLPLTADESTGKPIAKTTEKSLPESTEKSTEKSLPESGAETSPAAAKKITEDNTEDNTEINSGETTEETTGEISTAFPRTAGATAAAAGPADQGALPSPPPDDSEKNEGAGIGKK